MKLVVTRQLQWPDGKRVVEVSIGSLDYVNPDALVAKYQGEFNEYDNPIEAVEAAISICRRWRQDGCKDAKVGFGATGGFTFPFDQCSFAEARKWAKSLLSNNVEKCQYCGAKLEYDSTCKKWICPDLGRSHNSLGDCIETDEEGEGDY